MEGESLIRRLLQWFKQKIMGRETEAYSTEDSLEKEVVNRRASEVELTSFCPQSVCVCVRRE